MSLTTVRSLLSLPQPEAISRVVHFSLNEYELVFCYSFFGSEASHHSQEIEKIILQAQPKTDEQVYRLGQVLLDTYQDKIELAGIVRVEQKLISIGYNGIVSLTRNNKTGFLVANTKKIEIIVGKWKLHDYYLLATQTANQDFDEIFFRMRQGYNANVLLENLADVFHDKNVGNAHVLALIIFDNEEEKINQDHILKQNSFASTKYLEKNQLEREKIVNNQETKERASKPLQKSNSTLFSGIFSFFKNVRSLQGKKSTKIIAVTVTVLILFVLTVLYVFFSQRVEKIQALDSQIAPIQEEIKSLEGNKNENILETRRKANDLLIKLQTLKETTEPETYLINRIDEEIERVSQLYDQSTKAEPISDLPIFFDTSTVESAFIASEMAISPNSLILLDKETKKTMIVDLASLQTETINVEDNNLKSIATSDTIYFLGEKIHQIVLDEEITNETLETTSAVASESAQLAAYENYLYVVNKTRRNIYRFIVEENKLSNPTTWVRSAKGLNFDLVMDIAIDGTVWLSGTDGAIYNLSQGVNTDFTVTDLVQPFSSQIKLFTNEDTQQLYVLEPGKKRIVTLSKSGSFIREITHDVLASATDLVVDEKNNQIYILNGSLVFFIKTE